jgi:hypothetical protein
MKNTKIVDLGQIRDIVSEWGRVREHLATRKAKAFQLVLMGDDDEETVFIGGIYKQDPQRALSAALKCSAARALAEDPPPILQVKS